MRLFELQCFCQSVRPLGHHHPDDEDDDNDDDDCVDDNAENYDDLDMHPEAGHDSVASTQTSLRKLCLVFDGNGGDYFYDEMLLMIGRLLPGLSYARCRAHPPKQSAPDQA